MCKLILLFVLSSILTACEQKVKITLPKSSAEGQEKSTSAATASSDTGVIFTAKQLAKLPVPEVAPENLNEKEAYAYWEETLSKQPGYQKEKKDCEAKNKRYKLKLERSSTLVSTSTSVRFECE